MWHTLFDRRYFAGANLIRSPNKYYGLAKYPKIGYLDLRIAGIPEMVRQKERQLGKSESTQAEPLLAVPAERRL
jgi:hypothetical protein